jgi:hypothetical protein
VHRARTNIELAFVDNEVRRIAVPHFTFAQVVSAEASILRNIFGRILVKSGFVGRGGEMVGPNLEPGLN